MGLSENNMQSIPMTVRGAALLREELNELKTVTRPKIVADIAEAREHGDLKENAEYHAAREQQVSAKAVFKKLKRSFQMCKSMITKMPNTGKVIFGTTVTIVNVETDAEVKYRIVGDDEADIKNNLISVNSPIARGLIGKEVDDAVIIKTPNGEVEYEIIEVEYI